MIDLMGQNPLPEDDEYFVTTKVGTIHALRELEARDQLSTGAALLSNENSPEIDLGYCKVIGLNLEAMVDSGFYPFEWVESFPANVKATLLPLLDAHSGLRPDLLSRLFQDSVFRISVCDFVSKVLVLEDLWVAPDARGHDFGMRMLQALTLETGGELMLVNLEKGRPGRCQKSICECGAEPLNLVQTTTYFRRFEHEMLSREIIGIRAV